MKHDRSSSRWMCCKSNWNKYTTNSDIPMITWLTICCPSLPLITIYYHPLPFITLYYFPFPSITFHYLPLPAIPFHSLSFPCIPLHSLAFPSVPFCYLSQHSNQPRQPIKNFSWGNWKLSLAWVTQLLFFHSLIANHLKKNCR